MNHQELPSWLEIEIPSGTWDSNANQREPALHKEYKVLSKHILLRPWTRLPKERNTYLTNRHKFISQLFTKD